MDNQHKLIKGYRELSAEEIALMNEVKEAGVVLGALIDKIGVHLNKQYDELFDAELGINEAESDRLDAAEPFNWHAQAKHDLQVGIMKLVRSVAQPTTF